MDWIIIRRGTCRLHKEEGNILILASYKEPEFMDFVI
jgi:hypothetical protein